LGKEASLHGGKGKAVGFMVNWGKVLVRKERAPGGKLRGLCLWGKK